MKLKDFKVELRKAVPIIVRPEDLERDPRLKFMVHFMMTLKGLVKDFEYDCMKDACNLPHCCKPCNAWTFNTEVILEQDLPILSECFSGDPLNAFYTAEKGCALPWGARPVNCLVYICPRTHPIERTMFEAMVAQPLKAIRRFIWEYDRAPSADHQLRVYQQVLANYEKWPGLVLDNLERYTDIMNDFQRMLNDRSTMGDGA